MPIEKLEKIGVEFARKPSVKKDPYIIDYLEKKGKTVKDLPDLVLSVKNRKLLYYIIINHWKVGLTLVDRGREIPLYQKYKRI